MRVWRLFLPGARNSSRGSRVLVFICFGLFFGPRGKGAANKKKSRASEDDVHYNRLFRSFNSFYCTRAQNRVKYVCLHVRISVYRYFRPAHHNFVLRLTYYIDTWKRIHHAGYRSVPLLFVFFRAAAVPFVYYNIIFRVLDAIPVSTFPPGRINIKARTVLTPYFQPIVYSFTVFFNYFYVNDTQLYADYTVCTVVGIGNTNARQYLTSKRSPEVYIYFLKFQFES